MNQAFLSKSKRIRSLKEDIVKAAHKFRHVYVLYIAAHLEEDEAKACAVCRRLTLMYKPFVVWIVAPVVMLIF